MKKIFKYILYLIFILITLALIPYALCPIYDYPEQPIFTGNKIYNPYENTDSSNWYKANFHAHTYSWQGLTDGRKNNLKETLDRYRNLKYDFIGISNYQKIIDSSENYPEFVPVYEHGYNIRKNHQLVIGAANVEWLDYLFFQFRNNKQKLLNTIKTSHNIITLTHPKLRNAFSSEDVKELTGYDYLEIVNQNFGTATDLWDSALSAGNLVYGMADDDSHNWRENEDMGRSFNLINCNMKNSDNLINSLKAGKIIAIDLFTNDNNSTENLITLSDRIPRVVSLKTFSDTIIIYFNQILKKIEFIGQNGIIRKSVINSDIGDYKFNSNDTYIRIEAENSDHSKLYFNPLVKYNGDLSTKLYATINKPKTWALRLGLIIIIFTLIIIYIYKRKRLRI